MSTPPDLDPAAELALVPGIADMTPAALGELAAQVLARRAHVPELVVEQGQVGQGLVLLVRGAVKSVRTVAPAPGKAKVTRVLDVMRAPCVVPDASLFDGLPADASVVVIRSSNLLVIERRALQKAMSAHPSLERALFARFVREQRNQIRRLDELAVGTVEERIHRLLEGLASQHGTPLGHGRFIPLPLRRRDLASMVNATTETVSRLLAKLEREGRARSTRDGIWWRGTAKRAGQSATESSI
jgi:CRP-like cAMP-binding protein